MFGRSLHRHTTRDRSSRASLRDVVTALATALLEQTQPVDPRRAIERLRRVVEAERRDGRGGERLHLDAGAIVRAARSCGRGSFRSPRRRSTSTSAPVTAIGWQNGNRSGVRLTPITPAIRAASSGFPFGVPATSCAQACGVIETMHSATASRSVISFAPTSTIRATAFTLRRHRQSSIERNRMTLTWLPARRGLGPRRDDREAVGLRDGRDQVRAAAAGGRGHPPVLGPADADARELRLAGRTRDVLLQRGGHLWPEELPRGPSSSSAPAG